MTPKKNRLNILFLCTGNSCRSQMAEGWTRHLKSGEVNAYSAGIETHGLNPVAARVMKEAGVHISTQQSQHVDEFAETPLDIVVTVCDHAGENCPVFPGKARVVHIPFDDPPLLARSAGSEEEELNHYRRVRDEIRDFVKCIPDSLPPRDEEA